MPTSRDSWEASDQWATTIAEATTETITIRVPERTAGNSCGGPGGMRGLPHQADLLEQLQHAEQLRDDDQRGEAEDELPQTRERARPRGHEQGSHVEGAEAESGDYDRQLRRAEQVLACA